MGHGHVFVSLLGVLLLAFCFSPSTLSIDCTRASDQCGQFHCGSLQALSTRHKSNLASAMVTSFQGEE